MVDERADSLAAKKRLERSGNSIRLAWGQCRESQAQLRQCSHELGVVPVMEHLVEPPQHFRLVPGELARRRQQATQERHGVGGVLSSTQRTRELANHICGDGVSGVMQKAGDGTAQRGISMAATEVNEEFGEGIGVEVTAGRGGGQFLQRLERLHDGCGVRRALWKAQPKEERPLVGGGEDRWQFFDRA